MEKEEDLDHLQMREALTSVVSCSVASSAVRHAFVKVCKISETPLIITRAELMEGIVRDMHYLKSSQYKRSVDNLQDNYISDVDYRRDIYQSAYIKDFKEQTFHDIIQRVKPNFPDFRALRQIDLSGQLILAPDTRLMELSESLSGSPVEILALGSNNITDVGLAQFAKVSRSLRHLHTLHLNHNKFTDDGLEALFHSDNYPPTLRKLNISYNNLGKGSAWAIGKMFAPDQDSKLDELMVGGQHHYRFSLKKFLVSFIPYLLYPGARVLKKLDISGSGLDETGMCSLIALLLYTDSLEELNLSRLSIEESPLRYFLLSAIVVVMLKGCGLDHHEMMEIEGYVSDRCSGNSTCRVSTIFSNDYDLFDFAAKKPTFSRHSLKRQLLNMPWRDQVALVRLAVTEKSRLEELRLADERFFTEVKYVAPPVPRPRMPTKGNAAYGGGVTGIPRFSDFLSNEEIQQSNGSSIASRGRKSVQQTKKAPAITETFRYPRSVITAITESIRIPQGGARLALLHATSSIGGSFDEESVDLSTDNCDVAATDLVLLETVVSRSPPWVPASTTSLLSAAVHREARNRELRERAILLRENSLCPFLKEDSSVHIKGEYPSGCDDSKCYEDILQVTNNVYIIPGSTERVSLLAYLDHWKESSNKLSKRVKYMESVVVSLLDSWENMYDARHENPFEVSVKDTTDGDGGRVVRRDAEEEDWEPEDPSVEELLMGPNVEMAIEELFSTQDALYESQQQMIACLVCIESVFFDAFKKVFADRVTAYNPADTLSSVHKLSTHYPFLQLACHFVGYECSRDLIAKELHTKSLPVAEKLPKKMNKHFKPKAGQRFSCRILAKNDGRNTSPLPSISHAAPTMIDEGRHRNDEADVMLPPLHTSMVKSESLRNDSGAAKNPVARVCVEHTQESEIQNEEILASSAVVPSCKSHSSGKDSGRKKKRRSGGNRARSGEEGRVQSTS